MKDVQCKDCLWCETTFLMLKYQDEHTFCHLRYTLLDEVYQTKKAVSVNQDNIVQLNLFDL